MAYQPEWVRGVEKATGDRDCAERYEAIAPICWAYKRAFTVWDLGASLGYFGHRLAYDTGAFSVMVDSRPALVDVCEVNAFRTTMALTRRLTVEDLRELAASECPDVVLALNVLHHFEDWRGALEAVLALGEEVLIETPGRGDTGSANYAESQKLLDAIEALSPELIAEHPSHVTAGVKRPMYRLVTRKPCVTRGYAYGGRVRPRGPHPVRPHVIASTHDEKTIHYLTGESRSWAPGMNLWNWLQLGGSYPSRSSVQAAVQKAASEVQSHGDLRPWNFILRGRSVEVIDGGHRQSVDDATGVRDTVAWIARPELAYVS